MKNFTSNLLVGIFLCFLNLGNAQSDQNFNSLSPALRGLSFTLNNITYTQNSPTAISQMASLPEPSIFIITPTSSDVGFLYNIDNGGNVSGPNVGAIDYRFFTADGSEFKLASMEADMGAKSTANGYRHDLTINGYRDGSLIISETIDFATSDSAGSVTYVRDTNPAARGGDLTFDSNWENIDEVRFTGGNNSTIRLLMIDDLDFEPAVAGNPPHSVTITSQTNVNCNGGNSGSLTATVTDGTAPFTYSWTNGSTTTGTNSTTNTVSGLSAGTYTVTVTDANNDTDTATATITQPGSPLSLSASATNVSCNGGSDGAVDLTVVGGTPPYTFAWNNTATTEDLSGLTAATYSVTVTDDNGCTATESVDVLEPTVLTASASATNVSCNGGNDGAVDLTVVGGTPPYTFAWNNTATTEDLSGLTAATYSVTVTDDNGCTASTSVDVFEPTILTGTLSSTDASVTGGNDGTATISVSGGSSPYSYLWDAAAGNQTTATATNLSAGTYNVTVTDDNGCTFSPATGVTVGEPAPIAKPSYAFDSYIYTTGNATADNLTALLSGDAGASFKVYDSATGSNEITSGSNLVDGTTVYAVQIVGGIESSTRLAIPVTEICTDTQDVNAGATVADLTANPVSGQTASWFTAASGGTPLTGTDALSTQTYYVEQGQASGTLTLGSGFALPHNVAVDAQNNIIVADFNNNQVKRIDPITNNVTSLGSGFNQPAGVAVDAAGNILVADRGNSAVKRMDASGNNIVTLGSGFNAPYGLAVESSGRILIADFGAGVVQRMDANGSNIVTLGSGFTSPTDVTIDAQGRLIIADYNGNAVKRMNSDGTNIVTLGSGFSGPQAVAIDSDGNILVADSQNNAIKRMDSDGSNVVTVGSGWAVPRGIAVDTWGNIVVSDSDNNSIKRIDQTLVSNRAAVQVNVAPDTPVYSFDSYIYTTGNENVDNLTALLTGDAGASFKVYDAATGGSEITSGSNLTDGTTVYAVQVVGGLESSTRLAIPVTEICSDAQNLTAGATVADLVTNPASGQTAGWYTSATGGTALASTDALSTQTYYVEQGGTGNTITLGSGFNAPYRVAVDAAGNILVADTGNNAIKRMDANGNNIVTLGSGFNGPEGVAVDAAGNILVADRNNGAVKRMDANGNNIVTLGTGFSQPVDVAVDAAGNIIVVDVGHQSINRMDANGNNVVTLETYFIPYGVEVEASGNILVAELFDSAIYRIDVNGNPLGSVGSGFSFPTGVYVEASGNILVADSGNSTIRRMDVGGNTLNNLSTGLTYPTGVVTDANGTIIVADPDDSAIKRLNVISTSNRVPVQVNVNAAPTDVTLSPSSVDENEPVGTVVGTLSTTDADTGDTHTYSLVAGTGDDDNASFTVSGSDLETAEIFDFETKDTYSIRVETVDAAGDAFAKAITVSVNDVAEAPDAPSYAFDSYIYTTGNANVDNLTALLTGDAGASFKVYDAATGGSEITSGSNLVDGTTVHASQILGGLESTTRLAIPVTEICADSQTVNTGALVSDLAASPAGGQSARWFTSATGGTALSSTDALSTGTYYIEQGIVGSSTQFSSFADAVGITEDNVGNVVASNPSPIFREILKIDASGSQSLFYQDLNNFIEHVLQDIAVDVNGNIYLTFLTNYSGWGFISSDGTTGNMQSTSSSGVTRMAGIIGDDNGDMIFVEDLAGSIFKANSDLTTVTSLATGFNQIFDVILDSNGNIITADTGTQEIIRMDANGSNRTVVANNLTGLGKFITIDNDDNIYYTLNNILHRMDSNGNNEESLNVTANGHLLVTTAGDVFYINAAQSFIGAPIMKVNLPESSNRVAVQVNVLDNNLLSGSTPLAFGASCTSIPNSTATDDLEAGEPIPSVLSDINAIKSKWFSFTAPASGNALVKLEGTTNIDMALAVYDAPAVAGDVTSLGAALDARYGHTNLIGGTDVPAFIDLSGLTPGDTYMVQVLDGSAGGNAFCISVDEPTIFSYDNGWGTNGSPLGNSDTYARIQVISGTAPLFAPGAGTTLVGNIHVDFGSTLDLGDNTSVLVTGLVKVDGNVVSDIDGGLTTVVTGLPNNGSGTVEIGRLNLLNRFAGTAMGADLRVSNELSVQNDIDANGNLTFVSTADRTGVFNHEALLSFGSFVNITGNTTVERAIPLTIGLTGQAYRFLGAPVTSSGTIFDNWQEGGSSPIGYGVHITGSPGTPNAVDPATGLDQTSTGNPSMFRWSNDTSQSWSTVTSTNQPGDVLNPAEAYRLWVRGDRNVDLSQVVQQPSFTRLRATGTLQTDNLTRTYDVEGGRWVMIANPFQNALSLEGLMDRSTNVVDDLVYYWDPNLGGSGGQGAYVTYTGFDNGGTGSGVPATSNNDFLQPGQAAFVEASNGANGPGNDLIMEYDVSDLDKNGLVTGAANTVFSVETSPEIYIELWDRPALENGLMVNDATRIRFDGETAEPVGPSKIFNPGESIAIKNGGEHLALANMQAPDEQTLIALPIYRLSHTAYVIRLKVSDLNTATVYLEDRSTGERTELVDGWNNISFTADVSNGTTDMADRFAISFGEKSALPAEGTQAGFAKAISLYPNPVTDGELFLQLPKEMDKATVTITNMLGQTVSKSTIANGSATGNLLEVHGLTAGVYHVKVSGGDVEHIQKIVVQ